MTIHVLTCRFMSDPFGKGGKRVTDKPTGGKEMREWISREC